MVNASVDLDDMIGNEGAQGFTCYGQVYRYPVFEITEVKGFRRDLSQNQRVFFEQVQQLLWVNPRNDLLRFETRWDDKSMTNTHEDTIHKPS
jgi:hypothetical protein